IRELRNDGMTIVLSAHQMQLVERLADRLVVLNRGRTVLTGTLADVRRRWTTGSRLIVNYEGNVPDSLVGSVSPGVEARLDGDNTMTVFVGDGAPLGPVLAELGTRLHVRSIESHPV